MEKSNNPIAPSHYRHGNMETIDIIKAMTGEGFEAYCVGNVIKYIDRYKYKNGIEDLRKAKAYIDFIINAQQPAKEPMRFDDIEYVDPKTGKTTKLSLG